MTEAEARIYSIGHYALIALAFIIVATFCFVIIHNEIAPPNLVESCAAPRGK